MAAPLVFGTYELQDRIAEGGMAEVWRARARGAAGFEKVVVIKRLLPALTSTPGFAELLVREAKIAALLNHPNIVQIFDLGEERNNYFIAMEYVQGRDLGALMFRRDRTTEEPALSLPLRLWIVAEVARALDYAHRRRGEDGRPLSIVHRDISPQNVLLSFEGSVKVADFGIARADERELGRGEDPKVLRGKYAYMSPEQARGEALDRRSDLFSLGIVLYELVMQERLFKSNTSDETLRKVRAAEVPPIDPARRGIPARLAEVMVKGLARDPADRYGTASELAADLNAVLLELGVSAGETELMDVMHALFPEEEAVRPNKLAIDVVMRAYDDATGIEQVRTSSPRTSTDHPEPTHALPVARRQYVHTVRVGVLSIEHREREDEAFAEAVETLGGLVIENAAPVRRAVFGHTSGGQHATEHAVRAALELKRRLLLEGQTRVESVPKMVVVAARAIQHEVENVEVPEDAIAEADRYLASAFDNGVLVPSLLRDELSRLFHLTESDPPHVVGYRTRHEQEMLGAQRRTPLVGRRTEIALVTQGLVDAAESRAPTAYVIVGEPGSGKSRFCAELRALIAPLDVAVVSGRGDAASVDQSFTALAEIFSELAGVEPEDSPRERFAKIEELRLLGLAPREVRNVGELLGLSYPLAKAERAGRPRGIELVLAARKAISSLALDRTVLLLLEDLHWMDDATRQLLGLLLNGLERRRIVVVLTSRLGASVPETDLVPVVLEPLSKDASGRVFALRVQGRAVENDLRERIAEEAGGIPAWIEVMADGLREADALTIEDALVSAKPGMETPITDAMRTLAAARVADLRPVDRDILRVASAFVREPTPEILGQAAGVAPDAAMTAMRRLLALRVLRPARGVMIPASSLEPPLPGGGDWGGGHLDFELPVRVAVPSTLLKRALFEVLPLSERKRLHGAIAAVLERREALTDPEWLGELAYHTARSTDRRRAVEYLVASADASAKQQRIADAAAHLEEAAALLRDSGEGGPRALELSLRAAETALDAGQAARASRILAEVSSASASSADRDLVARARVLNVRAWAHTRRAEEMRPAIDAAKESVGDIVDHKRRIRSLLEIGAVELEIGEVAPANDSFDVVLRWLESHGDRAIEGRALCAKAIAHARRDDLDPAEETVTNALALAARLGQDALRSKSLAAMGEVLGAKGAHAQASSRFREAAEVARANGAETDAARLLLEAAFQSLEADKEPDAVILAEEALRLARGKGLDVVIALSRALQTTLAIEMHPDASYLGTLSKSMETLAEHGTAIDLAMGAGFLARAHVALGQAGKAAGLFESARAHAESAGHRPLARRIATRLAGLGPMA